MKSRKKTSHDKKSKRKRTSGRKTKGASWPKKLKFRLFIGCLFILLFLKFRTSNKVNTTKIESDSAIPPMVIPEKQKMKQQVKIDPNNPPWTEFDKPLVSKQRKKECLITQISAQVHEPLVYLNKNKRTGKLWKRRAVSCIDKCSKTLQISFESRRFKNVAKPKETSNGKQWDSTFVFLSQKTLEHMYHQDSATFNGLVFAREGVTYLNSLITSDLMSGKRLSTGTTLDRLISKEQREGFTQGFGCEYQRLGIEKHEKVKYLTMNKHVPVINVHLVIASTYPFFVFSKLSSVTLGSKQISIDELQSFLADNKLTGSHYIDTLLYSTIKKSAVFVFQSMRKGIVRRKGSFLFLGLKYKVTDAFKVYLDSIDYNTELSNNFAQEEFDQVFDLIQELHEVPVVFNSMVKGDKYGQWELLFSEKQESCDKVFYNPCTKDGLNERDLKKANSRVAKIHNTANRKRHEEARVLKKAEEQKKEMCRKDKLGYPSSRCDKRQKEIDAEAFNRLFDEHEKSFNPYQFIMAKPGEVFTWERV